MWQPIAYMAARTILGSREENKVAMAQNKTAMQQLGKQISQINLERAANRQRTSQALFNVQAAADTARSQVQLNAAASGTVGASVQDAVSTVNLQEDRNTAGIRSDLNAREEGFRLLTSKAIQDASAQMDWESGTDKLWNNILQNGMQIAGRWVAGKLTGDGSKGPDVKAAGEDKFSTFDDLEKSGSNGAAYNNYGYDLWGSKGTGTNGSTGSWKQYLGNS